MCLHSACTSLACVLPSCVFHSLHQKRALLHGADESVEDEDEEQEEQGGGLRWRRRRLNGMVGVGPTFNTMLPTDLAARFLWRLRSLLRAPLSGC